MWICVLDDHCSLYSHAGEPRLRNRHTGEVSLFLPPNDTWTIETWLMEAEDYAARRRQDARSPNRHHRESLACAEKVVRILREERVHVLSVAG